MKKIVTLIRIYFTHEEKMIRIFDASRYITIQQQLKVNVLYEVLIMKKIVTLIRIYFTHEEKMIRIFDCTTCTRRRVDYIFPK